MEKREKPQALVQVVTHAEALFALLKDSFHVGSTYELDLSSPVVSTDVLYSGQGAAAIMMRKLQALRYFAPVGIEVASDTVLTLLAELSRSLPLVRGDVEETSVAALDDFELHRRAVDRALEDVAAAIRDGGGEIFYFE